MTIIISREIQLASRPNGLPTAANFSLVQHKLAPLPAGQVLVRNLYMSVDPYMRGRMNETKSSYVPPFQLGKAMEGSAVGEVIESRAEGFKSGDIVTSMLGWREYFIAEPQALHPVNREIQPLSVYLGTLGPTGLTAWVGLNLVDVQAGDVIFISGAAGAVGNVAGQLAKLRGCEVIGSAGSAEKIEFLQASGFDRVFNYKDAPVLEQLNRAAPDGIDVYFDNVGGETLEAALSVLRVHGRIVACGAISSYNAEKPAPGPSNLFNITTKRLTMKGLIVSDSLHLLGDFEREVGGYFQAGKLKNKETVVTGIDRAVEAFLGLFDGKNIGKMVVKLDGTVDD